MTKNITKKNLRPQQAAPVERETVGANCSADGKIEALAGAWLDAILGY